MGAYFIVGCIIAILLGFIPANIANNKGKDFLTWYLYGVFFFLFAFIHALSLPDPLANSPILEKHEEIEIPNHEKSRLGIDRNSPAIISNYQLLSTSDKNSVSATFKIINLHQSPIVAIRLLAKGFDSLGGLIKVDNKDQFEILLQDLYIDFHLVGESNPVLLPNFNIRKLEFEITQIRLLTGEIINITEHDLIEPYLESFSGEHRGMLIATSNSQFDYKIDQYYAKVEDNYWLCSCGYPNKLAEKECVYCNRIEEVILNTFSLFTLNEQYAMYEEDRRLAEEKRQEDLEREAIKKREQTDRIKMKVFSVLKKAIPSAVIITIISVLAIKIVIPGIQYSKANDLFETKKYSEAIELFEKLGDYKDSSEKLESSKILLPLQENFESGLHAYNNGDYLEAYSIFLKIPDYINTIDYLSELEEIIYQQANDYYINNEFEEALICLGAIPDFTGSESLRDCIYFEEAKKFIDKKQYDEALKKIDGIVNPTAEMVQFKNDISLPAAVYLYEKGEYGTAIKCINSMAEKSNEAIICLDKSYLARAKYFYNKGDLAYALGDIRRISSKSEETINMEESIISFYDKYGMWLGKWVDSDNDYNELWIKPLMTNDGPTVIFEARITKSRCSGLFDLYEYNDNELIYHNDEYKDNYTTLTLVEGSKITLQIESEKFKYIMFETKMYREYNSNINI